MKRALLVLFAGMFAAAIASPNAFAMGRRKNRDTGGTSTTGTSSDTGSYGSSTSGTSSGGSSTTGTSGGATASPVPSGSTGGGSTPGNRNY